MARDSIETVASLRQRGPTLFLVAGLVLVIYAALYGLEAFIGMAYPAVRDLLLPTGYLLGVVGLLGLHPTLEGRMPTLPHTAALVAVVSLAGWFLLLALGFGDIVGGLLPQPDTLPNLFFVVHPLTMILAYTMFAIAIFRTDFYSRTVGYLLLAPPILFIVLLMGPAIRPGEFPLGAFVISSGQAMAHLAIGATLRTRDTSPDSEEPERDDDREVLTHD
jgi:hypothetical protein